MTLNVAVIVKLEPDFSEGSISYNPDGTLNRAETKSKLGAHSAIACLAAFYAKVNYGANISVATMGPPISEIALSEALSLCNADSLYLYTDRMFASADTLATAEVLKRGLEKMQENIKDNRNGIDLIFAGHRASDGETGQTGPQTAWKLKYPFFGNVIDYHVNLKDRVVNLKRLILLNGMDNIIEEIESPLPVFISLDPSYKQSFNTLSSRLKATKFQKEAQKRSTNFKSYLKIFDHKALDLDPKVIGLSGSPTIVFKVERIPKGKMNRKAEIIDGTNRNQIKNIAKKILMLKEEYSTS
ncbi:MAG: electron transfer flavoprotein subunit beta/FixA family protein [Nitrososphaeraceae archaeon]